MIVDTGSSDVGEDATRASDILSGIGDDLTGTYIDVVLTNGSGNGLTPSSEEANFSFDYPLYVESISNELEQIKLECLYLICIQKVLIKIINVRFSKNIILL